MVDEGTEQERNISTIIAVVYKLVKTLCTRAFGKFLAWYFISVTYLHTLSWLVPFLKSYISAMLWHKFHEDIIMQTQIILL